MLELQHLSFHVPDAHGGENEIIDDLSLRLESGRFTVITGPNGGGRTLPTCRCMSGRNWASGTLFSSRRVSKG